MRNLKASEEIRSILDRCKSGELDHNQADYFCGTSRCIAGWKVAIDFKEQFGGDGSDSELEEFAFRETEVYGCAPWHYALREWNLTEIQAAGLFSEFASFPEQYAVVEEEIERPDAGGCCQVNAKHYRRK